MAADAANANGVPVGLFQGLVQQESSYNAYAVSPVGAYGLAQLMPGTARDLGVNPYDPQSNLNGGAKYLRQMFDRYGNWDDALGAYNAGPGRWDKVKAGTSSIPDETSNYITRVGAFAADKFGWNGASNDNSAKTAPLPQQGFYADPDGVSRLHVNVTSADPQEGSDVGNTLNGLMGKLFGGAGNFISGGNTDKTAPTGADQSSGETGNAPINAGVDNPLAKLFDPSFWQGAILDIVVILAILALVLFGVYRVVKPK